MLARRPFDSPDHLYEPKWDGIRALAFVEGGRLRLLSRNSRDITSTFPELADLPSRVNAEAAVLDGELVCLDSSGHPSYTRLQERLRAPGTSLAGSVPVHFIAFDLLYLGGRPVMGEPLVDRKALLRDLLAPNELVQACDFIQGEGEAFFQATCELGLEGIVAKEKSSPYLSGKRSSHWLKVKRVRESGFVIGGYTFGGTGKELLGLYDTDNRLRYVGQVASGISASTAREVSSSLQHLHVAECPFDTPPDIQRFIFWCRPELVCQVEYGEFTETGHLAYPVLKALRDDKSGAECTTADAPGWPGAIDYFR